MGILSGAVCPMCLDVVSIDDYYMVALEKPYLNLFFHRDCLKKVEDMFCFLTENVDKWYNIGENSAKSRRK